LRTARSPIDGLSSRFSSEGFFTTNFQSIYDSGRNGRGTMTPRHPIQVDHDGIYYDIPKKLLSLRKKDKSTQIIQEGELMKRELLLKAKQGDEDAIETLKGRYRIKTFIHKGKRII
jgi:hypothetical protein